MGEGRGEGPWTLNLGPWTPYASRFEHANQIPEVTRRIFSGEWLPPRYLGGYNLKPALRRNGEVKRRALVLRGFGPDGAAMLAHDALDGGQADAGAFKIFGPVEPLEHTEKFVGVFHVETDAIITHEQGGVAILLGHAHFNNGDVTWAGVLDGVGK